MTINSKRYAIEMELQVNGVKTEEAILNEIRNAINARSDRDTDTETLLNSLQTLVCTVETKLGLTRGVLNLLSPDLSVANELVSIIQNIDRVDTAVANFSLVSIKSAQIVQDEPEERSTRMTQVNPIKRSVVLRRDFLNLRQHISRLVGLVLPLLSDRLVLSRPEFAIFLSLLLLISIPYLLTNRYLYLNEVMIAIYILLIVGIVWKFIRYFREKSSSQLHEVS